MAHRKHANAWFEHELAPKAAPNPSKMYGTGILVYPAAVSGKEINNTCKPRPLIKYLIHASIGEEAVRQVVLDLCGGSGNASRAALETGNIPIYVEKDSAQAKSETASLRRDFKKLYVAGKGQRLELKFYVRVSVLSFVTHCLF